MRRGYYRDPRLGGGWFREMLERDAQAAAAPPGWSMNGLYENGEGLWYCTLRKTNVGDAHGQGTTEQLARARAAAEARRIDARLRAVPGRKRQRDPQTRKGA